MDETCFFHGVIVMFVAIFVIGLSLERLGDRREKRRRKLMGTKPQSQKSLQDQLDELDGLAAQAGLYDAQDWVRQVRASFGENRQRLVVDSVHDTERPEGDG